MRLTEYSDKVQAYRSYFEDKPYDDADTLSIVQAKYEENGQYTVVVNKDYYHVDADTFYSLGIGQEVDTTYWEKAE